MRFGGVAGAAYAAAAGGAPLLFDDLAEAVTYFGSDMADLWHAGTDATRWNASPTTGYAGDQTAGNGMTVYQLLSALTYASRGSELLPNPSMAADTDWIKGDNWSYDAGGFYIANTTLNSERLTHAAIGSSENNKTFAYEFDYEMLATPSTQARIRFTVGGVGQNLWIQNLNSLTSGETGTVIGFGRTTSLTSTIQPFFSSSASYAMNYEVHRASIKEVVGAHLYQLTNASRPTYSTSGKKHINHASGTKTLIGYFPNLGTSACIATLKLDGSVVYLEGETISGAYTMPTHDWCIQAAFDRALTTDEKTAWSAVMAAEWAGM